MGSELPEPLVRQLLADPGETLGRVVVVLTVDPLGWPHPALLSYAEVLVVDPVRLRVGLRRGSRSALYLREGGRATLVFVEADLALYVKGEATPLPAAPGSPDLARFELAVRDVLEDVATGPEAGARLTGGVAFACAGEPAAWAARARRVRAALAA